MIFSTFCNFYLFLFLLFFLSSKSLIYKITQKINVLPYKIIRIKRTHQYRKNTVKGICKAKVIVATKQIREIIILNIKNILLFFNILYQSFQKKLIYLFFICPYFSIAISTCHNHICVETIGAYLSDVVTSVSAYRALRGFSILFFWFFHRNQLLHKLF